MDWNKFARDVHQTAVENGLWDKPRAFDDIVCECLVHLGRAYEEYRSGRPNYYHLCEPSGSKRLPCELDLGERCPVYHKNPCEHRSSKPHGAAAELGECVLRLLDYLETTVWEYPCHPTPVKTEDTFTGFICSVQFKLTCARSARFVAEGSTVSHITHIISSILTWAAKNNVPMETVLRELHECEKARAAKREGAAP